MRISDWSSDVCSSDLQAVPAIVDQSLLDDAGAIHGHTDTGACPCCKREEFHPDCALNHIPPVPPRTDRAGVYRHNQPIKTTPTKNGPSCEGMPSWNPLLDRSSG